MSAGPTPDPTECRPFTDVDRVQPLLILLVLSRLEVHWLGGIGRVTTAMACELARRGHEVHIAGRASRSGEAGALPGVTVHSWPADASKLHLLPRLVVLDRQLRPDVVHFHSASPHGELIAPFRMLRSVRRRPLIVSTPHAGSRWDRIGGLARLGMRAADQVVSGCDWTRERVLGCGVKPERIHVVWSGIDAVVAHDTAMERPMILALGRLTPEKGMDLLIDAFGRVAASYPTLAGWRLVIGGDGRELARLRALAAQQPGTIELPGFVSGSAKAELLRRAAIGVIPSRSDMIPGTMLEFQAHGLPVIATDAGGIAEASDDGRAALLVRADDVGALEKGLRALMSDRPLRAHLSEGASRVSRTRLWPDLAARLEQTYLDAIPMLGASETTHGSARRARRRPHPSIRDGTR